MQSQPCAGGDLLRTLTGSHSASLQSLRAVDAQGLPLLFGLSLELATACSAELFVHQTHLSAPYSCVIVPVDEVRVDRGGVGRHLCLSLGVGVCADPGQAV